MKQFKGIISPIPTPFTEDGKVYEQGFRNLLTFLKENGVHGVFAVGSYGSFPLMEFEERKQATTIVCKIAKEIGLQVILHAGHASTDQTVALAKYAQDQGADAVASVIPYYYSGHAYREENLLLHYEALCQAVTIPVHFYNNPRTTTVQASVGLVSKLMEIGVTGCKDSSSNMAQFGEIANMAWDKNPDFELMPGSASILLSGFLLGSEACVAGTSTAFPALVSELYQAIQNGEIEKATQLQLRVIRARSIQAMWGMRPAACYDILQLGGVDIGTCRRPWKRLNDSERADMKRILVEEQLL